MIAVTFALRSESSEFLRRLDARKRIRAELGSGTIAGGDVSVLHTGVGERATRSALNVFLGAHTPSVIVSSGFAGALSDELLPGDLLVADNFSDARLATAARMALKAFRVHAGRLNTASAIVHTKEDRIGQATADGAAAVDMETQFIVEICSSYRLPLLSLRAISDSPAAPFPAPPELLFDVERQRTNYRSLLLHVAKHPRVIGRLQTFGRQIADARRVLADALCCLIVAGALDAEP